MDALQIHPHSLSSSPNFMNPISKITPKLALSAPKFRVFCATSLNSTNTHDPIPAPSSTDTVLRSSGKARVRVSDTQYRENWLASLSCPFPDENERPGIRMDSAESNAGTQCVIGIDPDISGALALLKTGDSGCSAQVFDSPHLQILVGKRVRKRLDAKSIVQLLRGFDAPIGTIAYIEQSIPYPQDGKQGWWSGGFGYGLWIGILVASGFSVVPVPSTLWKNEFKLSGNGTSKDDSRRVASTMFPSMSSLLKRKKDHGRAEALLIAAYGKGLKMKSDFPCISEQFESIPYN
ncbi:hypothetical protein AAG906_038091 [Vitis piasezkii]